MVPNLNKDELYIIFNLLNGLDLHNASLVCRGPIFVVRNELEISSVDWKAIKREFIDSCKVNPSLHMLFFGSEYVKEPPIECCCRHLPLNCASILIERSIPDDHSISSIFFPDTPNMKVSTISLNNHPWDKGIYCEELKCFQIKKTLIWGIEADYLAICNHVYNSRICRNKVDCIAVLLSGTDMQSWITKLDTTYDNESMIKEFKETIKLKKHAVGFLACHENHIEIDYESQKLIQSYFPEIPIFTVSTSEAIAKYGFEGSSVNEKSRRKRANDKGVGRANWTMDEHSTLLFYSLRRKGTGLQRHK
ncbi:hypothetical protein M0802_005861 [Mischocyttarus mexicanus]|nr:hypothetical protein M0802_005861 [Mischocyttarus mexicanus]